MEKNRFNYSVNNLKRSILVGTIASIALSGCSESPSSSGTERIGLGTNNEITLDETVNAVENTGKLDNKTCELFGSAVAHLCGESQENTNENAPTKDLAELCEDPLLEESLLCIDTSDLTYTLSNISKQLVGEAADNGDVGALLFIHGDTESIDEALQYSLLDQVIRSAQQSTELENQELEMPSWIQSVINDLLELEQQPASNQEDVIYYLTPPPQLEEQQPQQSETERYLASVDIDGDTFPNILDVDIDGDGVENYSDIDMDGDGIVNANDPEPWGDLSTIWSSEGNDIYNPALHSDNDGIPDVFDRLPEDPQFYDANGNGVIDLFEAVREDVIRISANTYVDLMEYSSKQAQLRQRVGELVNNIDTDRKKKIDQRITDLYARISRDKTETIRTILGMNSDSDGDSNPDWTDNYYGDDYADVNNNSIPDGRDPYR